MSGGVAGHNGRLWRLAANREGRSSLPRPATQPRARFFWAFAHLPGAGVSTIQDEPAPIWLRACYYAAMYVSVSGLSKQIGVGADDWRVRAHAVCAPTYRLVSKMASILTQKELRDAGRLDFCYLFGDRFEASSKRSSDHVPPKAIFAKEDRDPPLILPTHHKCNQKRSGEDELIGQIVALLHGKSPPED